VTGVTDFFAPAPAPAALAPAAWYPDPGLPGQLRWFDGLQWTTHTHPTHGTAPSVAGWPHAEPPERNRTVEVLLPVNRTPLSIAAGYAGLVAMLIVPAPLALLLGVLALRDLRGQPAVGGRGRAWFGTIAGALGTAVWVLAILQ
jgi:hypothetical protein